MRSVPSSNVWSPQSMPPENREGSQALGISDRLIVDRAKELDSVSAGNFGSKSARAPFRQNPGQRIKTCTGDPRFDSGDGKPSEVKGLIDAPSPSPADGSQIAEAIAHEGQSESEC